MIRVYATPMRTRFRGITHRSGVLLSHPRDPGRWAEFSPFFDYDDDYSARWLTAAVEALERDLPEARRDSVPVNVTVPAVDAQQAHRIAASSGCTTAKVKVAEPGQRLADDEARLEAVRDALGAGGAIRVDANTGWSLEEAARVLPILDRAAGGLQYAEQPVATVEEMAALRRRIDVPIAADESIRRSADPLAVRRLDAADVAIIKVQPLGGLHAALDLVADLGLPAVVSSALESSVGIALGVRLAAALDECSHACGLATVRLFQADVTSEPLLPVGGALSVRDVRPDRVLAGHCLADADLTERWLTRLERVARIAGVDLDAFAEQS
ncbi:MAG: o-succinylbenzoate synthase [Bowdeniella nasicola]|nr:o-succinylbenzoate synthase [Bowdeniella nasicola]